MYNNGKLLSWTEFKTKFNLLDKYFFRFRQILESIPVGWKILIAQNPATQIEKPPPHLLQLTRIVPSEKLTSKLIYTILLHKIMQKPTSQLKISNILEMHDINWPKVYQAGRETTIDSYGRSFHYKCSQNILYLNDRLFILGHANSEMCSYCKAEKENILHLFFQCTKINTLWRQLKQHLHQLDLPELTPGSAFFGFHLIQDSLINQIHLIFRIAVYNKRESGTCSLMYILNKINSIKVTETNITFYNPKSKLLNTIKWNRCPEI